MDDEGMIAKEILRAHYAKLAESIIAPDRLGKELYQEGLISEHSLTEIETEERSVMKKNTTLLRCIRVCVTYEPTKLRKFAVLLKKYRETSSTGQAILDDYRQRCNGGSSPEVVHNDLKEATCTSASADIMNRMLGINDLDLVDKTLNDFNEWERLGISLGIKKSTLDRIRIDRRYVAQCRLEMISCWLKGNADDFTNDGTHVHQSFQTLIDNLLEINDKQTAEEVQRYLHHHFH
jgi:hypothetical protein